MKIQITERWLREVSADETAKPPKPAALVDGGRFKAWDVSLKGYFAIVGKRFTLLAVEHRIKGRPKKEHRAICRWGAPDENGRPWTEAKARRKALEILGGMAAGTVAPAQRDSSRKTLADAFAAHEDRMRARGRSDATIKTFSQARNYVTDLLELPIADLTGEMLIELHARIKREAAPRAGTNPRNPKGAALANRVITNIGTAWESLNRQMSGKLGNWNPARAVEKDRLHPKREIVADLRDWAARVATMRSPVKRDGLMFSLFTGLRSEDTRTIRWEHVDLEARTLLLPDPKGGEARAFTIPLPRTCVDILRRRKLENPQVLERDDGGWAFPAISKAGEVAPVYELRQKVHGERFDRLPREDEHSLRRTYETIAHEVGISELDLHVLTNHSFASHNVNATYVRQHLDHLRGCADRIEAELLARLGTPTKRSKAKSKRASEHLRAV